ncbi:MAG TPA: peptidylprolyl isomerase [Candidatus Kapabacteria bacterium]|nr:peptidylprolyl isomerase [Candidatus Kapabacteria bacterium]
MEENRNDVQVEQTPAPTPATPKRSPGTIFFVGILAVLLIALGAGYGVVKAQVSKGATDAWVITGARVFHMPVATVNGHAIAYADYADDMNTLKKFYSQNPDPSGTQPTDEQISDRALSRLLVNALIEDVAKKYNVSVSKENMDEVKTNLLQQFPDEAAAEVELQKQYGMTFNDYMEKVVRPLLLERNLKEAFVTSTDEAGKKYETDEEVRASHILFPLAEGKTDAKVKAEAQAVLNRIKKGEDFATLAKEFGSDGTKDVGGDLGWFGRGDMVPEFEQVAFGQDVGLVPDLVKTQFGYHVMKVEEKRMTRNFADFMDDQLRAATVVMKINASNPLEKLPLLQPSTSTPQ